MTARGGIARRGGHVTGGCDRSGGGATPSVTRTAGYAGGRRSVRTAGDARRRPTFTDRRHEEET
jgi:hypothetical protein